VQGNAPQAEAAVPAQQAVEVEKPAAPEIKRPAPAPASAEAIKAAAEQIESYLRDNGRSLEFRVDKDSGHTVVSVRNPATGELIRQIPGDETLRLASALDSTHALVDISI
jgi:flagellar protein FlaG